jgi:2'-5' RNA ligase
MPNHDELQQHYDAMWREAAPALGRGDVACDAQLAAGNDPRRGLTVIARPAPALASSFDAMLDTLSAIDPHQYRHPAADMHVTVLSLFTATADHAPELARADRYRAAVAAAVRGTPPFTIDFIGVSASHGAVVAQGFPRDETLAQLRERLRGELRARGLDRSLDGRYKLITAHATLLRFVRPLADPARFTQALERLRGAPLGSMHVTALEWVQNDWYMSSGTLHSLKRYPLT